MPSDVSVPNQWNELDITRQLEQLRQQPPAIVNHYVESIKQRFILRQDDKTALTRLKFLQTQVEQLKLAKEFQQLRDDLEVLVLEKEKRIKTLQLENEELDGKRRVRSQLEEMQSLREQKKIELEIAQLDQQIAGIKYPPKPDQRSSPEQERAQKKAACEAKIATLRKEQKEAVEAIPPELEDQRRKVSSMYADAIDREMDNLRKILMS